jgi:ankyrin repeat protein
MELLSAVESALLARDCVGLGAALSALCSPEAGDGRARAVDRVLSRESGQAAIHVSCLVGDPAGVRAVLERGPDLFKLDGKQRAAIHCAAEGGDAEVVGLVLDALERQCAGWASKSVALRDGRNLTPLHLACGHPGALARLCAAARAPEALVLAHKGLVRRAVGSPNGAECLRLLLAAREGMPLPPKDAANVLDEADAAGKVPLMVAVEAGSLEAARLLLDAGACATRRDADGQNVLHWAYLLGHREIASMLKARDATLAEVRDIQGRVPRDLIAEEADEEVDDGEDTPEEEPGEDAARAPVLAPFPAPGGAGPPQQQQPPKPGAATPEWASMPDRSAPAAQAAAALAPSAPCNRAENESAPEPAPAPAEADAPAAPAVAAPAPVLAAPTAAPAAATAAATSATNSATTAATEAPRAAHKNTASPTCLLL